MSAISGTMSSRTSSSGRLKDDEVTKIGISQYKSACSSPDPNELHPEGCVVPCRVDGDRHGLCRVSALVGTSWGKLDKKR
jgi:hypothetical protein